MNIEAIMFNFLKAENEHILEVDVFQFSIFLSQFDIVALSSLW